jgi:hypothetical protein
MGMVTMFAVPAGRSHLWPRSWRAAFHIEGPDFRCSVAIATFELIVGTVPTAVLKDAGMGGAEPGAAHATWQELNG